MGRKYGEVHGIIENILDEERRPLKVKEVAAIMQSHHRGKNLHDITDRVSIYLHQEVKRLHPRWKRLGCGTYLHLKYINDYVRTVRITEAMTLEEAKAFVRNTREFKPFYRRVEDGLWAIYRRLNGNEYKYADEEYVASSELLTEVLCQSH